MQRVGKKIKLILRILFYINKTKQKSNQAIMTDKRIILVLPTFGNPYMMKDPETGGFAYETYKNIKEVVGGGIEMISGKWDIHPMFRKEKEFWRNARYIIHFCKNDAYCNEDGIAKCCPNMGTIRQGGIPHFGEIAITLTEKSYKMFIKKNKLKQFPVYEYGKNEIED